VRYAKVCTVAIPFLLFHGKEEFQFVDFFMHYVLCVMQESVLRLINLCNRKRQNRRNEATTNHKCSAVPHSLKVHPENAVPCGIRGMLVIGRGFIQPILFC